MITIVIADHFKKGMKSLGCVGLTEVTQKQNLFQQQYKSIRSVFPKSKIVYIYGFDGKRFSSFLKKQPLNNLVSIYNGLYSKHSHGYSLSLGLDKINNEDSCLIVFGYEPIDKTLLKNIKNAKRSVAIIDSKKESNVGCVLDHEENKINHIFFGLENYISNIYMLKKQELKILRDVYRSKQIDNMFLFEIMNNVIANNGTLTPMVI